MRILVVALLVFALALSGCATKKPGDEDEDDASGTGTSTRSGSSTRSGTGGSSGGGGANHPPTAKMLANTTGQAPVNVTFELNGTDVDNDTLGWTLDFGDNATTNGTSLPANVTHLYTVGGLYNATLRVSDGNLTTNVTLQLNITAGTPFDQFVASGTPDLPCPQCSTAGANTGAGYRAGVNEFDSWFVEIPAGAAGQPFTATSGGNVDMVFRASCASSAGAIGSSFTGGGDEAGEVPADALCVLAWDPENPGETITLTIG